MFEDLLKQRGIIRLLAFFTLLVLLLHLPLWFWPDAVIWGQRFMVEVVCRLITMSGLKAVPDQTFIQLDGVRWEMTRECTAVSAFIVFSSFILVYPAAFRHKLLALAFGIPFLVMANVLRLFTLAWVSRYFYQFSGLFHDYIWQLVFFGIIAMMWLFWLRLVVTHEK